MSPNLNRTFPVHISMDHHTYNMNRFLLTFIIDNNSSLQSIFVFPVSKKFVKTKKKNIQSLDFIDVKWGGRAQSWKSWEKIVIIITKNRKMYTQFFQNKSSTRFTKKPSRFQKVIIEPKITTYAKFPTKNLNFYFFF